MRGRKKLPEGCENSQEEAELEAIADAMDAYDTMARPASASAAAILRRLMRFRSLGTCPVEALRQGDGLGAQLHISGPHKNQLVRGVYSL